MRRWLILLLLLAGAVALHGSGDDESFIVISITPFSEVTFDVKLKNPRTGYVHSVTVTIDIARLLHVGDRVRQRSERGRVVLVPVERAPEPEPQPFHFPFELPAGAAEEKKPPCMHLPCSPPPETHAINRRPLNLKKLPAARDIFQVSQMDILYEPGGVKTGRPCDVLTSGSFTGGGITPVGPLRVHGATVTSGYSDYKRNYVFRGTTLSGITTRYRGAIVVGAGGRPRIVRQSGNPSEIDRLHAFMGGGALLLHEGVPTSEEDLCCCQAFAEGNPLDPSRCGYRASQLVDGPRRIIAASKGTDFYVFDTNLGAKGLQQELLDAGFDEAILLDGGHGAFMATKRGVIFDGYGPKDPGANSTRMCFTILPL